jgi:primosomal protein N' (replication factor Y)
MMRRRLNPAPPPELLQKPVVGVLLPLPLAGAYDYKLPAGVNAGRGALVSAPLGNREVLGAVWGAAEGRGG